MLAMAEKSSSCSSRVASSQEGTCLLETRSARPWIPGEGVPEGEDQGSAVEDELRVGLAERAGKLGHLRWRVMERRPSSPDATQAAQRQRLMRRRAIRKRWQTGQRWT